MDVLRHPELIWWGRFATYGNDGQRTAVLRNRKTDFPVYWYPFRGMLQRSSPVLASLTELATQFTNELEAALLFKGPGWTGTRA